MPIQTQYYLLEAFLDGDLYSASADYRRFTTVDNQLYSLIEMIGDGRISGWDITAQTFPYVMISAGSGLIDGFYVNTYDDKLFELSPDDTYYTYAVRKVGLIGSSSGKSDVDSVTWNDPASPAAPAGFAAVATDSYTIDLTWNANTELDFDHYDLYRSAPGGYFKFLSEIDATTTSYTDSNLDEDTAYTYRLYAMDKSDFRSNPSEDTLTTPISTDPPPNAESVQMYSSEGGINLVWKYPSFRLDPNEHLELGLPTAECVSRISQLDHYEITCVELRSDGTERSSTLQAWNVNRRLLYFRIDDLTIGQRYKVTIHTVDTQGRTSTGVSMNVQPQPNPGPRDPQALALVMTPGANGVVLNLSWTDGDSPYLPEETYRYRIYVRVDGQPESTFIDVPIGFSSEQVSAYRFEGSSYYSMPENTLVTIRLTALDRSGNESYGNYLRVITDVFTETKPLRNFAVSFNANTADLTASWRVQNDTNYIHIQIFARDSEDPYWQEVELVDEILGRVRSYTLPNAQLGYVYRVRTRPFNGCTPGTWNEETERTPRSADLSLPRPPTAVKTRTDDRSIKISWTASETAYTASYNLYRRTGIPHPTATDWNLIDNIPYTQTNFTDYGLTNEQQYSYYLTSVDIYGRESLHLTDGVINVGFFTDTPEQRGFLSAPQNLQVQWAGNNILVTWDVGLEEYDSYTLYRSVGNLHSWLPLVTLDRDIVSYLDTDITYIHDRTYYYMAERSTNDAEIVIQTTNEAPQNSIFLGTVTASGSAITEIDQEDRRDIEDFEDPLNENVATYILNHDHLGSGTDLSASRISLERNTYVTEWTTRDGITWTTSDDIEANEYILRVDDRSPTVPYVVDSTAKTITFSEAIASVNPFTGRTRTGTIPSLELQLIGVEEVTGTLDTFRFDDIHAAQIGFGEVPEDQLPTIGHEGRLLENLTENTFLMQRFDDYTFIIPEGNTDTTKTLGDNYVFYSIIGSDGLIEEVIDFDLEDDGTVVAFRNPAYATDTRLNLKQIVAQDSIDSDESSDIAVEFKYKSTESLIYGSFMTLAVTDLDAPFTNTNLYQIDGIGAATEEIASITFNPDDNVIYVVTYAPPGTNNYFYHIDPIEGGRLYSNTITHDNGILTLGIEYDRVRKIIYSSDIQAFASVQGVIDPDTAVITDLNLGTLPVLAVFLAIAYDHVYDVLYGISWFNHNLYIIDHVTWAGAALVGLLAPATGYAETDLTYHEETDLMFTVGRQAVPTNVNSVNKTTAATGIYGSIQGADFSAAATSMPTYAWETGSTFNSRRDGSLYLGHFAHYRTCMYLRFGVDLPAGAVLGTATITMQAHSTDQSDGNSVYVQVSCLDPSKYPDSTDLSDDTLASISVLSSKTVELRPWSAFQYGGASSIDVTDIVQDFLDSAYFATGRNIIFKIEVLQSTPVGNYRRIAAFEPLEDPYFDEQHQPIMFTATHVDAVSEVTSDESFQSNKSYHFGFEFEDNDSTRWVRITSQNTPNTPNPTIRLDKRLRFWAKISSGSVYMTLGIREISSGSAVGADGGTIGPIEWVGIESLEEDAEGYFAPQGILLSSEDGWTNIDLDLKKQKVLSYDDGNNQLEGTWGVLEHFAFAVDPSADSPSGPFDIYVDLIEQVDDVLVAGTSQGIMISDDFGGSWKLSRYTDTPVHKFYRGENNRYIWAITATEALIAVDPAYWFEITGTTGVHYIRDIAEDQDGDMFISTDRGVYWVDTSLIKYYPYWRQTQPIDPFTTDCFGLLVFEGSSASDEIWVSTEIGVFSTVDKGESWTSTGLTTQNLPAYQMINISSDPTDPNIFAVTRKHVLRRRGTSGNFRVIANFEDDYDLYDIWEMAYFAGNLYISTGQGVFSNSNDVLTSISYQDAEFSPVFSGLKRNGRTNVAMCLDIVETELGDRMFIGQEGRLMMADENNWLSLRRDYRNLETPTFYIDSDQAVIGYIYSNFNNVVVFREPIPAFSVLYASYLPRRKYYAYNGGWAHTNPYADVFIYLNGEPQWLDFTMDYEDVESQLTALKTSLESSATLTDFNSLYPDSSTYRTSSLSHLASILTLLEEDTPDTTAVGSAIVDFIDAYSRFLSLVTPSYVSTNSLSMPRIRLQGISRSSRASGSRAAQFESRFGFTALDSTNININIVTGEVDFTQAYAQSTSAAGRAQYTFGKNDELKISIFNANVSNTGEHSHRELEDFMEECNTGLSAGLSNIVCTNLIKSGINIESKHSLITSRYDMRNIQSRFYSADVTGWYDIVNSTVDYELILSTDVESQPRYANAIQVIDPSEYGGGNIWVATDRNIVELDVSSEGISVRRTIYPLGSDTPGIVWDLFQDNNLRIYALTRPVSPRETRIMISDDYGNSWTQVDNYNLPNDIYRIRVLNGRRIVSSSGGMYYGDSDIDTWYPCDVSGTSSTSSTHASITSFASSSFNVEVTDFVVSESGGYFYTSGSGIEFFSAGNIGNSVETVNAIHRFKGMTWAGTDRGLFNDSNSVLSDSVAFGRQTGLEDTTSDDALIEVNVITSSGNNLYCGSSTGKLYRLTGGSWSSYQVPNFGPIHNIVHIDSDGGNYLVLCSYNRLRMVDLNGDANPFS